VVGTDYGVCNTPLEVTQETNYLHRNTSLPSSKCNTLQLHAQPGQQINLTLVDFSWVKPNEGDHVSWSGKCINYGQMIDHTTGRNVTMCGGGDKRERHLMVTKNNTVEIVWTRKNPDGRFLIKFQGWYLVMDGVVSFSTMNINATHLSREDPNIHRIIPCCFEQITVFI
jgi:hypothetical protein